MCGIVGYIGPKSVESVLMVGLEKLEYRGYDSAGLAVGGDQDVTVVKTKGRIAALDEKLRSINLSGSLGIGHTRWATHGEPSKVNAHPHINPEGSIAVVQNGIIENFDLLRAELRRGGYIFQTDTDTEVIPHLIDLYFKQTRSVEEAFTMALNRLDGKYAVAMVTEYDPGKIYFARNGAPLILAKGKDEQSGRAELFLASDLPAFIPLAKHSFYLRDKQWGYAKGEQFYLYDYEGQEQTVTFEPVTIKTTDVDKGGYEHYMLKEIYEQPDMIQNIIDARLTENNRFKFDELELDRDFLAKVGRIIIQACGTSLNAGLAAKIYLEQYAQVFAEADYSSEFRYRNPVANGDTLVTGISQSGETADTLAGLHEAKAKFLKVLSFVNNINSTIAHESDGIVDLMAGPEIGVASTKAYTAELMNLLFFALYLSDIKWILAEEQRLEMVEEIRKVPEKIAAIFKARDQIREVAGTIKNANSTLFLGRTYNYATALEGALKLKEISYIHAEGYAAGEFKHGPIALISEEVPVVAVVPEGPMRKKMVSSMLEVKARKGRIISIMTERDEEIRGISDHTIEIPGVPEFLTPLLSVIPLQLLSYETALLRGCDVDKPRNLAKSVTVE